MKARTSILLSVLVVAVAATVVWLAPRQTGEPTYQGKPLTFWVAQGFGLSATGEHLQKANEAVRAAGTNALPFWVNMLGSTNDSWFTLEFNSDFAKFKEPKYHLTTAEDRRGLALCAFYILGEEGKLAIPSLRKLLNNYQTCPFATIALAGLGPEGMVAITNELTNRKNPWRYWIAATLGSWNGKPPNFRSQSSGQWEWPPSVVSVIVLVLINCLQEDDLSLRVFCAQSLGILAKDPARVVPALTDLLKRDTNAVTRVTTVQALGQFGPAATPARAEINRYLQDPNPMLRGTATNALKQIDSAAADLHVEPQVL